MWIWTPAVVRDYVAKTGLMVDQVAAEYVAAAKAGKVSAAELSVVQGWQKAFRVFEEDASDWSGATADAAEAYRAEAAEYSAALKKKGAVTAPLVSAEPEGPIEAVKDAAAEVAKGAKGIGGVVAWVVGGGVAVAGILALMRRGRS